MPLKFSMILFMIVQCGDFCQTNLFGSKFQFKCHCLDLCDNNGDCIGNSTDCEVGWFGSKCQYKDLAENASFSPSSAQSWLTDTLNNTCNPDSTLQTLILTWDIPQPFTWLRITSINKFSLVNITLSLTQSANQSSQSSSERCDSPRLFMIDSYTLDIHCDVRMPFTQLKLEGQLVGSLCSLYVSGGRNVAFRQQTNQTSTLHNSKTFESKFAVDGIVPNSCNFGECSHTDIIDKLPRWEMTFDRLYSVRKFVIYIQVLIQLDRHIDAVSSRLQYFQLQATDINDTVVFEYNDNQTTQLVYTVIYIAGTAIGGVTISQKHTAQNQSVPFLTLSEVETYGDCLPGYWGLECKSLCPTDCTDTCHPGEGLCPYDTSTQSANPNNFVQECSGSDFGAGFGAGFGTGVGVAILLGLTTFLLHRLVHKHRMESTGKPPHGSHDQTAVVANGVKHRYEGVQLEKNVVDRSYEQIDTTGGHVDTALAEQNIYDKVDEQV